jgi:hypothetical protein
MTSPRTATLLTAAAALAIGAATGRLLLDSMNDADAGVLATLAANADPATKAGSAATGSSGPVPSPPPPSAGAPPYRLVLVVLDGLGEDACLAAIHGTPFERYDWRATVDVGTPSLSRPIYHVMLTGVPQAVSGIRNNAHKGRARADDLTAEVRAAGGTVAFGLETVTWFHDLFGLRDDAYERVAPEPALQPLVDTLGGRGSAGSPPVFGTMSRMASLGATLTILHFTSIDHAGHQRGAASSDYRRAVEEAIRTVAEVRTTSAGASGDLPAVWMLGSDHGHLAEGGHGGPEPAVRRTTWLGLWPSRIDKPVEIPGVVPADRLAATFAAILGVPAPREALGEPLALPDRPVRPGAESAARRREIASALQTSTQRAHTAVLARASVWLLALACAVFALMRRERRESRNAGDLRCPPPAALRASAPPKSPAPPAKGGDHSSVGVRALAGALLPLAAAALPAVAACLGFWLLGPGMTLSAIRTQIGFLLRSVGSMALGAAIALPLARRLGATAPAVLVAAAAVPASAYAVTAGSMGHSQLPDSLLLVFPATGLVPWAVALALSVVSTLTMLFGRKRKAQAPPVAQTAQPDGGPLRDS